MSGFRGTRARSSQCEYCQKVAPRDSMTIVPKNPELRERWIRILGGEFGENLSKHTNSFICKSHFRLSLDNRRRPHDLPMANNRNSADCARKLMNPVRPIRNADESAQLRSETDFWMDVDEMDVENRVDTDNSHSRRECDVSFGKLERVIVEIPAICEILRFCRTCKSVDSVHVDFEQSGAAITRRGQLQMKPVRYWMDRLVGHLYNCVKQCPDDSVRCEEMAVSFFQHMRNIHAHFETCEYYTFEVVLSCSHGPISDDLPWIDVYDVSHQKAFWLLFDIITTGNRLSELGTVSDRCTTSAVESFNARSTYYTPKEKYLYPADSTESEGSIPARDPGPNGLEFSSSPSQRITVTPKAFKISEYEDAEKQRATRLPLEPRGDSRHFDTEVLRTRVDRRPSFGFREAAETGLLDVKTGKIVHPERSRRYSIPRAVHTTLVAGDAAKLLIEQLNVPVEEVAFTTQTIITSKHSASSPVFEPLRLASSQQPAYTPTDLNWHGSPSELRNSSTDPLASYTTVTSSELTEEWPKRLINLDEVEFLQNRGYSSQEFVSKSPVLKQTVEQIEWRDVHNVTSRGPVGIVAPNRDDIEIMLNSEIAGALGSDVIAESFPDGTADMEPANVINESIDRVRNPRGPSG
ncbi:unnamed protein product [Caenorhabditis sp. 36 PRJEB53466]|nr:unnamed protein product [Caenorhabditis sp. 36 PRJEB53466]